MKTLALLLAFCVPGASIAKGHNYLTAEHHHKSHQANHYRQHGLASWYGPGFAGRKTASGARFNPALRTIAHRTLKLGTLVRITNLHNHKSVVAKVTDRGPFHGGRIADLSKSAALAIGLIDSGTAPVLIVALG